MPLPSPPPHAESFASQVEVELRGGVERAQSLCSTGGPGTRRAGTSSSPQQWWIDRRRTDTTQTVFVWNIMSSIYRKAISLFLGGGCKHQMGFACRLFPLKINKNCLVMTHLMKNILSLENVWLGCVGRLCESQTPWRAIVHMQTTEKQLVPRTVSHGQSRQVSFLGLLFRCSGERRQSLR